VIRRLKLPVLLAAAVICSGAIAGCGHEEGQRSFAATEGPFVDVGPLKYQVQMSRQLNPYDAEDNYYLRGIDPKDASITKNQTWFAIFMRVNNETDYDHRSADRFVVTDTEHKVYRPVKIDPLKNPFIYRPEIVKANDSLPIADTPAATGPIQGSMILYKFDLSAYQNRPLELHISKRGVKGSARIDLDV
jgi:hypothetical protein